MKSKAFVGTTFPAAVGAMRAAWDQGLVVGKDIRIAAINIESPATFMKPSVTGLNTPDMSRLLRDCFTWFASETAWTGPLCLQPPRAEFFSGESTGATATKSRMTGR